ncbi:MAG: LexA family transcriptional regulator [Chitinophagales bacterium]|nr:LexA family transcriptional regulator [Chitinophagales bacterium]
MKTFALNLKFLRRKNKWSQEVLAKKIEVKRSAITDFEREKSEASFSQLIALSEVFSISIDDLLKKDLQQESYTLIKNRHTKILAITVNKENKENIELVQQKAQAGYTAGYADLEYLATLPAISIPHLSTKTYRAFEIEGYSMLPIEPGSIVLCSYVENYKQLNYKKAHILVTQQDGIVFKRIKDKGKQVLLISDNPEYLPYSIFKEDVLELWEFEAFISFNHPQHTNLERIEQKLDVLLRNS